MSRYRDEHGNKLYEVGACDAAGSPWTVATLPAKEAVLKVEELRARHPFKKSGQVFFVNDPDDPEAGDVQMKLEDELWNQECKEADRG